MNCNDADELAMTRLAQEVVTVWNAHAMLGLEEIHAVDAEFCCT